VRNIFMFMVCMIVSIKVYPGAVSFGPAVGVERVNNLFNVDLGAIKGLYRFDNGVTIGGVAMFGDISFQDVPGEARYEAIIGYTTVPSGSNFAPYAFLSKGARAYYSSRSNVLYHTVTVGTRYILTPKIYLDTSYRHRNTNDINWESNLYSLGMGYNISDKFTVQITVGNTRGDYHSSQVMLSLVSRL